MNARFRILAEGNFTRHDTVQHYDPEQWNPGYGSGQRIRIAARWSEAEAAAARNGRLLYVSRIFRLGHVAVEHGNSRPRLSLHYGDTDYRDYVGTRGPDGDGPRADPIGTVVIPVTSDGFIPIGTRSRTAEVNPGRYFTFGGFFDRGLDLCPVTGRPDIFSCIQREIREELGIGISDAELRCLGVVYDLVHPHPEVCFMANISQTAEELYGSHWRAELDSMTMLRLDGISEFLARRGPDTTDSLVGALEMFSRQRARMEATATC